ncbi:hypothetical protein RRF57_005187 [Xylaria bambusicola]|uniref:Uncharacterized protein n=1 Tax=Xylaria bambusicola TaxID=326684 RepID=A0AAN7UJE1_9PEZI
MGEGGILGFLCDFISNADNMKLQEWGTEAKTYIPSDNRTEADLPQAREDGKGGKDQRSN